MTENELQSIPKSKRRLIVFTDENASNSDARTETKFELSEINKLFLPQLFPFGGLAYELIKSSMNARKSGIDLSIIPTRAVKHLSLPPNHPQEKVIYVIHPVNDLEYIPISSFHHFAFKHKFAEVIRLLSHLGATSIKGEYIHGYGKEFLGKAGAEINGVGEVEGKGEKKSSKNRQLIYEANLAGTTTPTLPDDLSWYHYEPTWKAIAESRMKFGLKDFDLRLEYSDNYGIDAEFKAKVQNSGFQVKGEFDQFKKTTWHFYGTFLND
ncbi:hypothetical protein [Fodinibius sp. SL11]|uniref:hypothetical protein n=1 Tax=Fodinibius sp. SL11 TaxID=3425690 RepID=UPI003F885D20